MEKKMVVTLMVFLMMFIVVSPVMASELVSADEPDEVPVVAVVSAGGGGVGSAPFFKWKWELPDEDYYTPCTQIWPKPFGEKVVTCYMVATDPNGADDIERVFIKVFHPDGTEKVQVEATELDKTGEEIMTAIDIGVDHGCIPPELAEDMIFELSESEARAWKADFIMHYHQPPGDYLVRAHAVDSYSNVGEYENTFYYHSLMVMKIDFSTGIDFGEIVPGKWQIVSGDYDMGTPKKPTVQSGGNDPLWISLHFTSLVGEEYGKTITTFDAVFKGERIEFMASDWVMFSNPLDPCQTEKIDFSIHALDGTPADTYRGYLHISIGSPPED